MYKFKDKQGRRTHQRLWAAIVILAIGEVVLAGMLLKQTRMIQSTMIAVSSQINEIKQTDPIESVDRQIVHINRTVNGLMTIVGSMKLNPDQLNTFYQVSGKGNATVAPTDNAEMPLEEN